MKEPRVSTAHDMATRDTITTIRIDDRSMQMFGAQALDEAVRLAAKSLADEIIEEIGPKVIERLSVDAIANMTMAEAAAAVNRTLKEKIPDKVIEVIRENDREPVILQRGFFGGVRRI